MATVAASTVMRTSSSRVLTLKPATPQAKAQASHMIRVLLSVRSKPQGKPVQKWPKAYFWTKGPRMRPPRVMQPRATQRCLRGVRGPSTVPRPTRRPSSTEMNIMLMWEMSRVRGTWPL